MVAQNEGVPEFSDLIALRDLPALLPKRPDGKKIALPSIYRWVSRGVRGARLQVWSLAGRTYTTREALAEFVSRTTQVGPGRGFTGGESRSPAKRSRQSAHAAERLEASGW